MNDNSHVLNNIACPKCGEEMYDSSPMITLTSIPVDEIFIECLEQREVR